jgi:hypothetical protein
MTTRRKFIQHSGVLALSGLLASRFASEDFLSNKRPVQSIGLQLYTLGDLMTTDAKGTLQKLAAIGYKEVESAG